MRYRFHDKPTPLSRCRSHDLFDLARVAEFDASELGEPIASYSSADYMLSINRATGDIEIFERPQSARRTTDKNLSHAARLHNLNEKNNQLWRRQS